ncbi:hypothetical protein EAG_14828 [Camponotus floridanus]|uniref:Uncharacterized protein n=1 Tax=Camponotus floridanus TaxID=104421 RepID=E2A9E0_CAMFO|nr:hypothetical protein EAG_14828 [Camponotus floridanus]
MDSESCELFRVIRFWCTSFGESAAAATRGDWEQMGEGKESRQNGDWKDDERTTGGTRFTSWTDYYADYNSDSSKDIILATARDSVIPILQSQLKVNRGNLETTEIKEAASYRKNKPPLITS